MKTRIVPFLFTAVHPLLILFLAHSKQSVNVVYVNANYSAIFKNIFLVYRNTLLGIGIFHIN